jgi:Carboxypeptidase regulatory-like domain
MRKLVIVLAAVLLVSMIRISVNAGTHAFAVPTAAEMAEITGRIRDINGHAVAGLKISLRNWFGSDLASAVTDENGVFDLRNVRPGRYHCNFRPLGERSRGETVMLDVPAHFLHMNLTVNRNPPALARAESSVARLS